MLQFCIMICLEVYMKAFKFIFIISEKTTTMQLYNTFIFWLHDSNKCTTATKNFKFRMVQDYTYICIVYKFIFFFFFNVQKYKMLGYVFKGTNLCQFGHPIYVFNYTVWDQEKSSCYSARTITKFTSSGVMCCKCMANYFLQNFIMLLQEACYCVT